MANFGSFNVDEVADTIGGVVRLPYVLKNAQSNAILEQLSKEIPATVHAVTAGAIVNSVPNSLTDEERAEAVANFGMAGNQLLELSRDYKNAVTSKGLVF